MPTADYTPDAKRPSSANPAAQPQRRRETPVVLAALLREDLCPVRTDQEINSEIWSELPLSFVIPAKAEIQGRYAAAVTP
jgi:hypothetical protein